MAIVAAAASLQCARRFSSGCAIASAEQRFAAFRQNCIATGKPPHQLRAFVEAGAQFKLPVADRPALQALGLGAVANSVHRLVWLLAYRDDAFSAQLSHGNPNADSTDEYRALQDLAIAEFDGLLRVLGNAAEAPQSRPTDQAHAQNRPTEQTHVTQEDRVTLLSFFRNVIANAFAYGLCSSRHIADVISELRKAGWGGCIVDPMAGTGFHALLFARGGADVIASDAGSASLANSWYPVVGGLDAADGASTCEESSALWLSWPPSTDDAAARALASFRGDFVAFLGDGGKWSGCPALRQELFTTRRWEQFSDEPAAIWPGCGIEDRLCLLRRNRHSSDSKGAL